MHAAIALDSTYFPGPSLELARGNRVAQTGTGEPRAVPVLVFDEELEPKLLDSPRDVHPGTVALAWTDPWLIATWQNIAAHRNLPAGWDGGSAPPPTAACLDGAEVLANNFSAMPMNMRPVFAVDAEGRPSFAIYTDDVYLHLTVDDSKHLSFYAVVNGRESFGDEEEFDALSLPAKLLNVLG